MSHLTYFRAMALWVARLVSTGRLSVVPALFAVTLLSCGRSPAEDTTQDWHDDPDVTQLVMLQGVETLSENGRRFRRFRFRSAADLQKCYIRTRIPPSHPVEEFRAATRINSTHAGIRLAVRLVLPNQIDPDTGKKPLTTWLAGNRSSRTAQWEPLEVRLTSAAVENQLRLLRTEYHSVQIDATDLYVDGCALVTEFSRGPCVVDAEPVTCGPLVPISLGSELPESGETPAAPESGRARIERSRLLVAGRPIFVRLVPDHGESSDVLHELGVNAVWVPDYRGGARSQLLRDSGLLLAATPPHPRFDPTDFSRPLQGLPPLEQVSELVDLWYLGTRVSPDQLPHLLAWSREVRSADRLLRRPLMADVVAAEGLASREVDLVAVGPPTLHRNMTLGQFRNQILFRSRSSSGLTLPWTWVQTESKESMTDWRAALGLRPLVVEPEQIAMQTIAALSAGARGIGFWTTQPIAENGLEESEVGLAIAQACLQIELLESWLIDGRVRSHIAVEDRMPQPATRSEGRDSWLRNALNSSPLSSNPDLHRTPRRPDAAVISGNRGLLILVGLWDSSTQFVPAELYAREARLTVAASETASAARITATGVIGQRRRETAGGLPLTLNDLDQFGIILVASDPLMMQELGRRVQRAAPRAAELQCRIARLKLARVEATCAEVDRLMPRQPSSGAAMREQAGRYLRQAEADLQAGSYRTAEQHAQACLRALRGVQNLYWQAAISQLPTPTASPFTIAFSALPDHWRMMAEIGRTEASPNLLPTGRCDNLEMLQETGWEFPASEVSNYTARADVRVESGGANGFLRLAAWKSGSHQPDTLQPAALVLAPPVPAQRGEIVEIQGRVRLGATIRPEEDTPLLIFDSELGPEFAVRPALEPAWRTFRLFRPVAESGEFRLSFAVQGAAEVHLDEITVRTVGRMSLAGPELPTAREEPLADSIRGQRQSRLVRGAGHSEPSDP